MSKAIKGNAWVDVERDARTGKLFVPKADKERFMAWIMSDEKITDGHAHFLTYKFTIVDEQRVVFSAVLGREAEAIALEELLPTSLLNGAL